MTILYRLLFIILNTSIISLRRRLYDINEGSFNNFNLSI